MKRLILFLIFGLLLASFASAENELLTNLTHYFSFDNDNFTNKVSPPEYYALC
jgi:hypothetical protein